MSGLLPWALTIIGCIGFKLAGRKVWWAWYVNIANQVLWVIYAVVTRQWAFILGVPVYLTVFIPNAVRWTREHRASQCEVTVPRTISQEGGPT